MYRSPTPYGCFDRRRRLPQADERSPTQYRPSTAFTLPGDTPSRTPAPPARLHARLRGSPHPFRRTSCSAALDTDVVLQSARRPGGDARRSPTSRRCVSLAAAAKPGETSGLADRQVRVLPPPAEGQGDGWADSGEGLLRRRHDVAQQRSAPLVRQRWLSGMIAVVVSNGAPRCWLATKFICGCTCARAGAGEG